MAFQRLGRGKGPHGGFGHLVGDQPSGKQEPFRPVPGKRGCAALTVEHLFVKADFRNVDDLGMLGFGQIVDCVLEGGQNDLGLAEGRARERQIAIEIAQLAQALAFALLLAPEGFGPGQIAV